MSSQRTKKSSTRQKKKHKRRSKSRRQESTVEARLRATLRRLASSCRNPARVIELYYWSVEPELAAVLRNFVNLPADVRQALHAFLASTTESPEAVRVHVAHDARVTLYCDALSQAMEQASSFELRDKRGDAIH